MTIAPFVPRDQPTAGYSAGARATSRARWRRCCRRSRGWFASGRRLGLGALGLHGRRRVHPHGLVAPGRDRARGRARDRRRADVAQSGALPQRRGPVEDSDAGRRLPQLDAASRRERDLPDGPGSRDSRTARRGARPIDARPDPGPADALGRPDRGRAERQRRSRLVRDRGRPPADSRRGCRRVAFARCANFSSKTPTWPARSNLANLGSICRRCEPNAGEWIVPSGQCRSRPRPVARPR